MILRFISTMPLQFADLRPLKACSAALLTTTLITACGTTDVTPRNVSTGTSQEILSNERLSSNDEIVAEAPGWIARTLSSLGLTEESAQTESSLTASADNQQSTQAAALEAQDTSSDSTAPYHFELYAQRASMNSSDFEQYSVNNGVATLECGHLRRQRTEADFQKSLAVAPTARQKLTNILSEVALGDLSSLPQASESSSLFDGGAFSLKGMVDGQPFEVQTTLDTISDQKKAITRRLYTLYQTLRDLPEYAPCGNEVFYNIARTPPQG